VTASPCKGIPRQQLRLKCSRCRGTGTLMMEKERSQTVSRPTFGGEGWEPKDQLEVPLGADDSLRPLPYVIPLARIVSRGCDRQTQKATVAKHQKADQRSKSLRLKNLDGKPTTGCRKQCRHEVT
jgi:hypothetical protein